jgi:three-Cys-motif partner protein
MNTTADASYWPDYSNLQAVKHALIRRYLGGWFPKLGPWAGRVLYVDTHAGRGRHLTGDLGSPLIALRTLLDHHYRDALLRRCEFQFHLIERDEGNFEALRAELREFGPLPRNVVVIPRLADAFAHLSSLRDDLRRNGQQLAPAFVFVDPYGFKIPGALLRQVMRAGRVELFVNVIWRELGMALSQKDLAPGMATTLTEIFDGEEWRGLAAVGFEEKADRAIDLLKLKLEAHWSTPIRMLGDNDTMRYERLPDWWFLRQEERRSCSASVDHAEAELETPSRHSDRSASGSSTALERTSRHRAAAGMARYAREYSRVRASQRRTSRTPWLHRTILAKGESNPHACGGGWRAEFEGAE